MAKDKLRRFAENLTFPHLFQLSHDQLMAGFEYRGRWKDFFKNDNPIVLELGCGKGEYTLFLAERRPDRNYIGIDIKGARIWKGLKMSHEAEMGNVAFIRTHVQVIRQYFTPGEVAEIWITFPDPQPRQAREKKRLTHPRFLDVYREVLVPKGLIHLKTDNAALFDWTLEMIKEEGHDLHAETHDLYHSGGFEEAAAIQTFYESKFLAEGILINYLEFSLK
ncbi:MAG: tRNA (guanosine(46)-N7)-methyltransferase TrmB [Bacteroidota bacterium]